jgi:hypothetical protein
VINADEEYRFEFQPFDVLNVEDADVTIFPQGLALVAGNGTQVEFRQA